MIRPPSYSMATSPEVMAPAVPKTINRLFVTSLVLNGWMFGLGAGYAPMQHPSVFEFVGMAVMGAITINHFVLWYLAKKERRMSLNNSALKIQPQSSNSYPVCLINIPNIVFACIVAVLFTFLGITPFSHALGDSNWRSTTNQRVVALFLGVATYAECGVLWALFGLYVQNRKVYLKNHPKPAAKKAVQTV